MVEVNATQEIDASKTEYLTTEKLKMSDLVAALPKEMAPTKKTPLS